MLLSNDYNELIFKNINMQIKQQRCVKKALSNVELQSKVFFFNYKIFYKPTSSDEFFLFIQLLLYIK